MIKWEKSRFFAKILISVKKKFLWKNSIFTISETEIWKFFKDLLKVVRHVRNYWKQHLTWISSIVVARES